MTGKARYTAVQTLDCYFISDRDKELYLKHYYKSTRDLANEYNVSIPRVREIIWRVAYSYYMKEVRRTYESIHKYVEAHGRTYKDLIKTK